MFEIENSVRLVKADMKEGARPFIGATDSNNGITAFCGNTNKSLDKNVLGVNYNGNVGECFYHPYECIFSDDVKRFKLKNREGNKYIYLFLQRLVFLQGKIHKYGHKFNKSRMTRSRILVPVDSSRQPDWEFMEFYMKEIERTQLERWNDFANASNCITN